MIFQGFVQIFPRGNKDGSVRIILNVTHLNVHVEFYHFKMETLQDFLPLVIHDCFFASIVLNMLIFQCLFAKVIDRG